MDAYSSWISEDNKTLSSIISIIEKIPTDNDTEIFDLLDEEKSIILNNSENNADCSLFININNARFPSSEKTPTLTKFITDILIISEAKVIETFINTYHEYYKTFQSILISDMPDTKIYKTFIMFANPQKHVLLKLQSLFCKEAVWIYGIFIKLSTNCPLSAKSVQLEECGTNRLDSILKEKNVILSEKAENFKKLYSVLNASQNTLRCEKTLSLNKDSLEISTIDQLQCLDKLKQLEGAGVNIPTVVDNVDYQKMFTKLNYEKLLMGKMKDLMSQTKPVYCSSQLQNLITAIPHENEESFTEYTNESQENNFGTVTSLDRYQNEVNDNLTINKLQDTFQEKLISDLLEKKFNEFEIKMKAQIEKSNLVILNKLSHLESLVMKIIGTNTSS